MSEEGRIREGEAEIEPEPQDTEAEDDFELHGGKKGGGGGSTLPIEGPVPS
jgi:hypothetical protein